MRARTYTRAHNAQATPAYICAGGGDARIREQAGATRAHEQVRSAPARVSRCALRVAARETRLRVVISAGIKPSELAPYGSKSLDLSAFA